jgi:hypothetical protein
MTNTGTVALRELLERVKENPNGVGDALLMLHGDALAELEVLEQAGPPAAPMPTCEHREAKFGCDACVTRVRAKYPEFPLQTDWDVKPGPVSVPWPVADRAWAAYSARYGRDQSVERLAQRGGFGWGEMDLYFPGGARPRTSGCCCARSSPARSPISPAPRPPSSPAPN